MLTVYKGNARIAFYEKFRFTVTGETHGHFFDYLMTVYSYAHFCY